jgi:hypothetical protein
VRDQPVERGVIEPNGPGLVLVHRAIEERNARLTEQAHALLEAASHLHDLIAGASK